MYVKPFFIYFWPSDVYGAVYQGPSWDGPWLIGAAGGERCWGPDVRRGGFLVVTGAAKWDPKSGLAK